MLKNPEIRFKDDNNDWENKQLKEVSISLKSGTLTKDKLSTDGRYPVMNGGTSYYGYYDDYNNEDAFTISARGDAGFCRFHKGKFWAGGLCYPYKGKDLFDTHFISILLNKYEKEIKETCVIRTSIPAVNKSDIKHFNMNFPNISVQNKISSLFSEIDQNISSQESFIQKLKDTKSALLIKIFPQENQSVPEIRFVGFTNDWEQRKCGSVFTESREIGHSGDIAKKLTVKLWGKGVLAKDDTGSAATQYYIRHAGQFIYSKLDFLNAAFGVVPEELDSLESTANLPAFDCHGINAYFMYYRAIQPSFYITNGTIADGSRKAKGIHADTFLNMPLMLPSKAEQDKIVGFLQHLDKTITLHQRKPCTFILLALKPLSTSVLPTCRYHCL